MGNHANAVRKSANLGKPSGLVRNKRDMVWGLFLGITFLIVLGLMFSPLFKGENALQASDRLFNSISKGSTRYIPGLLKKNEANMGKTFAANLKFSGTEMAAKASKILTVAGVKVASDGKALKVEGDLGVALAAALKDSQVMFADNEKPLVEKYGISGREALFVWWNVLKETDKDLTRQKRFKDAAFVSTVIKKGVECGYNFFGIAPQTAKSKALPLTFSLVFYVVYTLWWGYAILLIFEGIGLEMKAGVKKEV